MTLELIECKEDKNGLHGTGRHVFHGHDGGACSSGRDGAHGGAPSRAFPQGRFFNSLDLSSHLPGAKLAVFAFSLDNNEAFASNGTKTREFNFPEVEPSSSGFRVPFREEAVWSVAGYVVDSDVSACFVLGDSDL